jgi:hypothetical protein
MKEMLLKLFSALIFSVLLCPHVYASVSEPAVSASFDRESAYVGDVIAFNVRAELPEDAYIAANNNINFDNFDTLKISAEHISDIPNVYMVSFALTAYKTGTLDVEPAGITYITSSGGKRMFFTPPAAITVNSVLGSGSEDIKDIKPLKKFSMKFSHIAAAVFLIAVIAALFVFLIKDISAKTRKRTVAADPVSEALAALDKLLESAMIKNGDARTFYYGAAEILRTYISGKYGFNAMEMTSAELIKKFEDIPEFSVSRRDLRQYLDIFNLARYAGFKASERDMLDSLDKTKEFIKKL